MAEYASSRLPPPPIGDAACVRLGFTEYTSVVVPGFTGLIDERLVTLAMVRRLGSRVIAIDCV
jgi:hypothetical protein